jgi:hypothetical protein
MTVTELRQALEKLEADGKGGLRVLHYGPDGFEPFVLKIGQDLIGEPVVELE